MKEQLATEGGEVQKERAACLLSPSGRGEEGEGETGDGALGMSGSQAATPQRGAGLTQDYAPASL